MWWRSWRDPTPYDDDWEDQPTQGPFYQWVLGLVLPLALIVYGICVIATQEATFRGGRMSMVLHGHNAIAYGVVDISLAIFLHCHYFWGNIYDQIWFAVLGKIIAGFGFIAGLVFLIVEVGIFVRA